MAAKAPVKLEERARRNARKRTEKKAMIAESALQTLQELGYANTSLRDIAAQADLSLGMLHYYFEDKAELITFCVAAYKKEFTALLTRALDGVEGRDEVIARFSDALAESIFTDGPTHRLWYDIRTQALFDPAFRSAVSDIEQTLVDVVERAWVLAGRSPDAYSPLHYAIVDGVFRYLMQRQTLGDDLSQPALAQAIREVLDKLF
ncbi:MAG: TetR/AcrR family transcriptional regulator [Pseudomonadota bacterium]|nr:TetR/AcrR family transcriptional regulator [Pseudomonadota bacterium]MEE3321529.1 TetR/AcrR family transcriptional regulator [Pseudomonadota bacterium]